MNSEILSLSQSSSSGNARELDYSTVAGLAVAFGLVFLAITYSGELSSFFDLSSLLIVLGGTFGATLINHSPEEILRSSEAVRAVLWPDRQAGLVRLRRLVELATKARNEGLLVLEEAQTFEPDPFLRNALQLLADGLTPEEVQRTLEIEIAHIDDRHRRGAQCLQTMAAIAPAMGLIGTLIGLVQMLENLNDPSKIGPGMATALLTTFYGSMLAYALFTPLAGKLRARSEEELILKQMTLEGIMGIISQVNPRLLEQRLFGFLPPQERFSRYEA